MSIEELTDQFAFGIRQHLCHQGFYPVAYSSIAKPEYVL